MMQSYGWDLQLMAVIVGYHRDVRTDVISCELARQGVWHGMTEASDRGGLLHVWPW